MKDPLRLLESLSKAACKGADPALFDATSGEAVEDALSYCDRCTVQEDCEEYVKPRKSFYDGICSAKVWKNGLIIEPGLFDEGETDVSTSNARW